MGSLKITLLVTLLAFLQITPSIASGLQTDADDPDFVLDVEPGNQTGARRSEQDLSIASLVGLVYEGNLSLPGWKNMGGGLLGNPVWMSSYRRGDGAYLELSNWALPRKAGSKYLAFRITDVLFIPPMDAGLEFSYFCRQPRSDVTTKIIALFRPNQRNPTEWWPDVRLAWSVALDSGRISPIAPMGIECANEGWGE